MHPTTRPRTDWRRRLCQVSGGGEDAPIGWHVRHTKRRRMKSKVKYPITAQHTLFLASRLDSSEPGSAASRAPRVRITTRTRNKTLAARLRYSKRVTEGDSAPQSVFRSTGLLTFCSIPFVSWAARLDTLCTFGLLTFTFFNTSIMCHVLCKLCYSTKTLLTRYIALLTRTKRAGWR